MANLRGVRAGVFTVSDRCSAGQQVDVSGPAVARLLVEAGAEVVFLEVIPDERHIICEALRGAGSRVQLAVTTGGTGLARRDVTPEATMDACDRMVPGLAELIRADGARHTPFAALGRGVAGVVGETLIVNLPGSPAGAESSLQAVLGVLPHALALLAGETAH